MVLSDGERRLVLSALGRMRGDADHDESLDGSAVDRLAGRVIGSGFEGGWPTYKSAAARRVPVSDAERVRQARVLARSAAALGETPEQVRGWLLSKGFPDEVVAAVAVAEERVLPLAGEEG